MAFWPSPCPRQKKRCRAKLKSVKHQFILNRRRAVGKGSIPFGVVVFQRSVQCRSTIINASLAGIMKKCCSAWVNHQLQNVPIVAARCKSSLAAMLDCSFRVRAFTSRIMHARTTQRKQSKRTRFIRETALVFAISQRQMLQPRWKWRHSFSTIGHSLSTFCTHSLSNWRWEKNVNALLILAWPALHFQSFSAILISTIDDF